MINIKIDTEITLNDVEQALAKGIAKRRYNRCRQEGISNSKIGNQSNELTDLEGFAAELAFCKLHNVYPDLLIQPRSSSDDNGDCLLHIENGRVDVKATKYQSGRLIAPLWKSKDSADIYALMIGTFPTYTFKGFIKSSDFLIDVKIGKIKNNRTYMADQSDLVDLETLNNSCV
jgi:hypothetical protein|tara:strand:- start:398 stop:919 length:522 start_codon:yes stop_codon:yes gene_type:complete